MSVPLKVSRIKELHDIYHPIRLVCDESHIGAPIITEMRLRGIGATPQKFSSVERNKLLSNMKPIIDGGLLVIPMNREDTKAIRLGALLTDQLMGFKEERSKLSNNKLLKSTALHDDIAMALAMAINAGIKQKSLGCMIASSQ